MNSCPQKMKVFSCPPQFVYLQARGATNNNPLQEETETKAVHDIDGDAASTQLGRNQVSDAYICMCACQLLTNT